MTRVDLRGAPETMWATLYGKALDADAPNSVLGYPAIRSLRVPHSH